MHIEKYTRSAVGHILKHNEPCKARRNRENVDNSKTNQNYNFVGGHGIQNLKKILNDDKVYCNPRKDVNVLCSVCLTAPKDLPQDREKEFFAFAFEFLKNRYAGPCVSCWVHLDEPNAKTHMHYAFCPLVYDNKKNRFKVNAKSVVCKYDLQTLHHDFEKYINQKMHLSLHILNGATENGNKSILELKNNTLKEEITKLKKLKNQVVAELQQELCR